MSEQISDLKEQVSAGQANQELLTESLTQLELQLQEQGWIQLFGSASGGKELTKTSLDTLYDLSRVYWMKNPLIKRSIEVQNLYVFAQGLTIRAETEEVNVVVQKFLKDRKNLAAWNSHLARMENERDLACGGNLFIALFPNETTGEVTVRTIPMYEVGDIITDPDDKKTPWFYRRNFIENTFSYANGVTAGDAKTVYYPDWRYNPTDKPDNIGGHPVAWETPVFHVKINCLPDMKWGISEVYASIDWAKAYKTFLENWSKLVAAYARHAHIMTTKGGAKAIAAAKSKIQATVAGQNPNTGAAASQDYLPVAGTIVAGENITMQPYRTSGATTSADDAHALRLMVSSSSGIPDQILNGDPSTGNLATAKAMERPLELQFLNRRAIWVDIYTQILDYVVDMAIESGKLDGDKAENDDGTVSYELNILDKKGGIASREVTVEFPPLLEHDTLATMQAISAAVDKKVIDLRTAAGLTLKAFEIKDKELLDKLYPPDDLPSFYSAPQAPDPFGQYNQDLELMKADAAINQMNAETARALKEAMANFKESEDEGRWITTDAGNHLLIGGDGKIKSGIGKGKTPDQAFGKGSGGGNAYFENPNFNTGVECAKATASRIPDSISQYGNNNTQLSNSPLGEHCENGYIQNNEDLRRGKTTETTDAIDKIIDNSPNLPEGLELYRGVGSNTGESLANAQVGDTYKDPAYQSFSLNPGTAADFGGLWGGSEDDYDNPDGNDVTILRAITTSNQKGVFVSNLAENELILPRGKNWKVIGKSKITAKTGVNFHIITVV
jgi:hypothetical protein